MTKTVVSVDLNERSYDIYIGSGLLTRLNDTMPFDPAGRSAFIIFDQAVEGYAETVREQLDALRVANVHMIAVKSGEASKSFAQIQSITEDILTKGVSRNSFIIAVGGGVIGDLAGFCAAITLRGIPFIQIPTTLLSQVDSSVGGKTGINTAQGKNLIGAFYQPEAVVIDIDTLKTLPKREIRAGYAEIVKYGLIRDKAFFTWLEENGKDVYALEPNDLIYAIEKSVRTKADIVAADETEQSGLRALLNLGHTFGHALEAAAGYDGTLLHGEAVSIGMVMAFDASVRMGLCDKDDLDRVIAHLTEIGLPVAPPALDITVDDLIATMRKDKKAVEGNMQFIMTDGIGTAHVNDSVPLDIICDVMTERLSDTETQSQTLSDKTKNQFKTSGGQGLWRSIFSSRSSSF